MKNKSIIFAVIALALLTISANAKAAQGDTIYVLRAYSSSGNLSHVAYYANVVNCTVDGMTWKNKGYVYSCTPEILR